ncbi:MAG: DUF3008 family protein [Chthoniobacterales bacterium]
MPAVNRCCGRSARTAKRGEKNKSSRTGASKGSEKSITKKELEDFASTKRENLPRKKAKK